MKKNKLLIVFLLIFVFGLTGCVRQLQGPDGRPVRNEDTGQALNRNILCAPTDGKTIKLYEENKQAMIEHYEQQLEEGYLAPRDFDAKIAELLDVNELIDCSDLKITTGGWQGFWTTLFVRPLVWSLITVGEFVGNYGLAIIFVTLIIRAIMYPVTLKTAKQSENLKKAKPELDKINKKYKDKKDQDATMKKSQEMMAVYKKHKISPLSGCLFGMIQIPMFLAFFEALHRLPVLSEGNFLIYRLAVTPMSGGGFYFILPALVLAATYFAFKHNASMNMGGDQEKQMKIMMKVMMVMIFFFSFNMSTGIIIYWITNNSFTILQNLIVKRSK